MRQEGFGGGTVSRVYERERLRRMARKLGFRLLKFGNAPESNSERNQPHGSRCQVVEIHAPATEEELGCTAANDRS